MPYSVFLWIGTPLTPESTHPLNGIGSAVFARLINESNTQTDTQITLHRWQEAASSGTTVRASVSGLMALLFLWIFH